MMPTFDRPPMTMNRPRRSPRVAKSTSMIASLASLMPFFLKMSMIIVNMARTMQMMPLIALGVSGINEATISAATMRRSITVGTISLTFVRSSEETGSLLRRKRIIMIGTVAIAPISTAKKIPSLPFIQKNSMKFISA